LIDVALAGLGKMGLSHLSIIRAHPDVRVVGVCDAAGYLLDVLNKYTGVPVYKDYAHMLDEAGPEAVIIATPTHLHAPMVREAIDRNMHVFCEKPLFLDLQDDVNLTEVARGRGLVTQVGYHNRFVATFQEVHRLLRAGAIGTVNSALAEAYGPVVLRAAGRSWRSQRATGGGCLYDYAAHPLDLLTWYLGSPRAVSGSQLTSIFSTSIDDAVAATLHYETGTAQLCVNWSDESQRKMTTKITLWGRDGRIYADRQELHVYLRDTALIPEGYRSGWNVRYTTDMTLAPWFYLRGEEYSAQLDAFIRRVTTKTASGENDFSSAAVTDRVIAMIGADTTRESALGDGVLATAPGRHRHAPQSRLRRVAMAAAQGLRSVAQAARGESLA
jgi:scyllo-inositol 2-dehydrogenase (NADP+)